LHLIRVVSLVVGRVIAKLTVLAAPPALQLRLAAHSGEKRAGVESASRDGKGGAPKTLAEGDGGEALHLAQLVALVVGRVVAELAVEVPPPTLEVAVTVIVEDGAREMAAGRDGDGGAT